MLSPLANLTYRHLFAAQVLSLLGTGLATVALGLLAFDLAGADAGAVLGTALAIKMVAYVGIAPVAGAFVHLVGNLDAVAGKRADRRQVVKLNQCGHHLVRRRPLPSRVPFLLFREALLTRGCRGRP